MRPQEGRIADRPFMRSLKMIRKFLSAGIAIAVVVSLTGPVFAGANDYVFEPVKAEVKKGDDVVVSVRLKHKATGKPVADAVIVQTRIDMVREQLIDAVLDD